MEKLIAIRTFCSSHQIDVDFVYSIYESGLIEIITREEDEFIEETQLPTLEKSVRLHRDLQINSEGIAAIFKLLEQVDSMQEEINRLRNRLDIYER